jgi:hypothetical protein
MRLLSSLNIQPDEGCTDCAEPSPVLIGHACAYAAGATLIRKPELNCKLLQISRGPLVYLAIGPLQQENVSSVPRPC